MADDCEGCAAALAKIDRLLSENDTETIKWRERAQGAESQRDHHRETLRRWLAAMRRAFRCIDTEWDAWPWLREREPWMFDGGDDGDSEDSDRSDSDQTG